MTSTNSAMAAWLKLPATGQTWKAGEVDAAHQKVLEALTQKLGVKFR